AIALSRSAAPLRRRGTQWSGSASELVTTALRWEGIHVQSHPTETIVSNAIGRVHHIGSIHLTR
ncbi:MAG: hypothetical protein MI861_26100, partial [Pirellulales bacterium]|nr:hypothetical protein [Pirellulales bacterium]